VSRITLTADGYEAAFLPELGMLGVSLKWRGAELLSMQGGLAAYRSGHTTGMPLLAPWANRLSRLQFRAAGVDVDLRGLPLHAGADGLPRHGTMSARSGWRIVRREPSRLRAAFEYDTEELLAAFPFPHRIEIDARVSPRGLRVEAGIVPTSRRSVPIAFGWHPYFKLPGPRRSWRLRLPAREHHALDERGIPTGVVEREAREREQLGDRSFDDLYRLGRDRRLELSSGELGIDVRFDAGYPWAQVYAPAGKRFVALEPMTAPTDALTRGAAPSVRPGGRFTAAFTVSAH
jgi:galactose mutarotase-like enzyme